MMIVFWLRKGIRFHMSGEGSTEPSSHGSPGTTFPFRTLMSDRSFQVRYGSTFSTLSWRKGSCKAAYQVCFWKLGFNEVDNTLPNSTCCSFYVDDIALCVAGNKLPCMLCQLRLDICGVTSWCSVCGFKFSTSKMKAMFFRRSTVEEALYCVLFCICTAPLSKWCQW